MPISLILKLAAVAIYIPSLWGAWPEWLTKRKVAALVIVLYGTSGVINFVDGLIFIGIISFLVVALFIPHLLKRT